MKEWMLSWKCRNPKCGYKIMKTFHAELRPNIMSKKREFKNEEEREL